MPIYPFRCDACAVEFEVTRKEITDVLEFVAQSLRPRREAA